MANTEKLEGQAGSYEILTRRPFAYGRISVLYEARSQAGETVCLKLLREASGERRRTPAEFFREVEAQQRLRHPNILRIIDFGQGPDEEPGAFIVTPLYRGGNLRELLHGRSHVPLAEVLSLLSQVAGAVDFAHSQGFIHGDIKPENILLTPDRSQAVLSDFGVSRYFPLSEDVSSRAISDEDLAGGGGASYLSPEELEDGRQSSASDIYSFAVVAFELLTGKLPFDTKAPPFRQMRDKVAGNLIDPDELNPRLPATVSSALRKGLSKDPASRPDTAAEFCRLLEEHATESRSNAKRREGFWSSLDSKGKVALLSGVIAALAGIIAAIIKAVAE